MLELQLYGDIGSEVNAADVCAQIAASEEPINIRLFSDGGNPFHGFALFNAIKNSKNPVTVTVDAMAGSAATFLLCGSSDVVMSEAALLYLHLPQGTARGDVTEHGKVNQLLAKIESVMAAMYAAKTGKNLDEVRRWMAEETYFTAAEALAVGLVDRVIPADVRLEAKQLQKVVAKHGSRAAGLLTFAKRDDFANREGTTEGEPMNVLEKLGLSEGAKPEEVLAALVKYAATNADDAEEVAKAALPLLRGEPDGDEAGAVDEAAKAKLDAAMDEIKDLRAQLDSNKGPSCEARAQAAIDDGRWPEKGKAKLIELLAKNQDAEGLLFAKGTFAPRASRMTSGGRPAGAPAIGGSNSEAAATAKAQADSKSIFADADRQIKAGRRAQ